MNDERILDRARQVCTPKQLDALTLKAAGYGNGRIARILGISTQAVTARLDGAYRRLRQEEAAWHRSQAGTAATNSTTTTNK